MQNRNVCKILTTFLLLVLFLNIVGKALSERYFCRIFVGTLDIVHDLNRTPTQCIQLERDKPWQYFIFLLKTMTLSENRVTNRDRPWHTFFLEPKVWKWPSWSYGRTLKVIENHGSPNVIKIWCPMTNRTVGRPHSLHPAKYANRPDDGSTGMENRARTWKSPIPHRCSRSAPAPFPLRFRFKAEESQRYHDHVNV